MSIPGTRDFHHGLLGTRAPLERTTMRILACTGLLHSPVQRVHEAVLAARTMDGLREAPRRTAVEQLDVSPFHLRPQARQAVESVVGQIAGKLKQVFLEHAQEIGAVRANWQYVGVRVG